MCCQLYNLSYNFQDAKEEHLISQNSTFLPLKKIIQVLSLSGYHVYLRLTRHSCKIKG